MRAGLRTTLADRIFYDRYALKDRTLPISVGDVAVFTKMNGKFKVREVSTVVSIDEEKKSVVLRVDGSEETVDLPIDSVDFPKEVTYADAAKRIVDAICADETEQFREIMTNWLSECCFVPGGRILSGAGAPGDLTFYNCFVIPIQSDSRSGIINTVANQFEIMSRGGGVGINVSILRPTYDYVKGVNGRSSGSVCWADLYSKFTNMVEQGGCFGPNERIATSLGLIKASELADILDRGETVEALTHKGLKPITAVFRNGVKDTVKVRTKRGLTLQITPDHKVAHFSGHEIVTTPISDLKPGSEILSLIYKDSSGVDFSQYDPCHPNEITYPVSVLNSISNKVLIVYSNDIVDLSADRISFAALGRILERIEDAGDAESAEKVREIMSVIPDEIESISSAGSVETFDFEVADVHLLSGGGIYTSNSRRGALMIILDVWHPDTELFIKSKREKGFLDYANISVGITDDFMNAVLSDGEWSFVFPDRSYDDYDQVWNGDIRKWRDELGRKVNVYKTVKAREIFKDICTNAWASAEPGLFFADRANALSNSRYMDRISCTNPCGEQALPHYGVCLSGDSLLSTMDGIRRIRDFNSGFIVSGAPSDDVVVTATAFKSGYKPLLKVTVDGGMVIKTTPDHIFMTDIGEVKAQDLISSGAKVRSLKNNVVVIPRHDAEDVVTAKMLGWMHGDGWLTSNSIGISFNNKDGDFEIKDEILAEFHRCFGSRKPLRDDDVSYQEQTETQNAVSVIESFGCFLGKSNERRLPNAFYSMTMNQQLNFMAALFTADGWVDGKGKSNIGYSTSSKFFAEELQMVLGAFGIQSRLHISSFESNRNDQCRILITKESARKYMKLIGFLCSKKTNDFNNEARYFKDHQFLEVVSVESCGEDSVYDFNAPATSTGFINGILVHNCNLGAINLSQFSAQSFYDSAASSVEEAVSRIDFSKLTSCAFYSASFLDNVIDKTSYFIDENKKQQLNERRVGLGIMGLAELFIRIGVTYGSPISVELTKRIFRTVAEGAYSASVKRAKTRGPFPGFIADKFLDGTFAGSEALPESLRNDIREYGIRNVTLLTVAPTGTTGSMMATSTGLEPYFRFRYEQRGNLGAHVVEDTIVSDYRKYFGLPEDADLPSYFVTTEEVSVEGHVAIMAAAQMYVDASISKTVNMPNSATVEDVMELYTKLYAMGCKGGTVYRDGSRSEQCLVSISDGDKAGKDAGGASADTPDLGAKPASGSTAGGRVDFEVSPLSKKPRPGYTHSAMTHMGRVHVTLNFDESSGEPFDVFLRLSKAGTDIDADTDAMGRLISLILRLNSGVSPRRRLELAIEQISGISCHTSVGFGPERVSSLPDGIAKCLRNIMENLEDGSSSFHNKKGAAMIQESSPEEEASSQATRTSKGTNLDLCPNCHCASVIRAEGCMKCLSCGDSRC